MTGMVSPLLLVRTDEQIRAFAARYSACRLHVIEPGELRFQSLTMRRLG
jgi:hypothetical protein